MKQRVLYVFATFFCASVYPAFSESALPSVGTRIDSNTKRFGDWHVEGGELCTAIASNCVTDTLTDGSSIALVISDIVERNPRGGVKTALVRYVFQLSRSDDEVLASCDRPVRGHYIPLALANKKLKRVRLFYLDGQSLSRMTVVYSKYPPCAFEEE